MIKYWKLILVVFILLLLMPFVAYISSFKHSNISSSTAIWGSFGDFISGTISIPIGVATLLVTVYIAREISKKDERRSLEALRYDRQRFLNEQRIQGYKKLSHDMMLISEHVKSRNPDEINKCINDIHRERMINLFVFPELHSDLFSLILKKANGLLSTTYKMRTSSTIDPQEEISSYLMDVAALLSQMQQIILKETQITPLQTTP